MNLNVINVGVEVLVFTSDVGLRILWLASIVARSLRFRVSLMYTYTRRAYFVTLLSFWAFHVFIQAVLDIVDFTCHILSFAGFAMRAKSDGFTEERLRGIGVTSAQTARDKMHSDVAAVLDNCKLLCEYWA